MRPVSSAWPLTLLTDRERVKYSASPAQGMSDRAIAEKTVLTVGTVKWYNRQIYSKLDVRNRTQAVARDNWICCGAPKTQPRRTPLPQADSAAQLARSY